MDIILLERVENLGDLGEEVAKHVRAHDRLAHDDAAVIGDPVALDGAGGGEDHFISLALEPDDDAERRETDPGDHPRDECGEQDRVF